MQFFCHCRNSPPSWWMKIGMLAGCSTLENTHRWRKQLLMETIRDQTLQASDRFAACFLAPRNSHGIIRTMHACRPRKICEFSKGEVLELRTQGCNIPDSWLVCHSAGRGEVFFQEHKT